MAEDLLLLKALVSILLIYSFFYAQDPSAILMMFPSRSMTNSAAQQKWGCLLVSVPQTAPLCCWKHRLVRHSTDRIFPLLLERDGH